MFKNCYRCFAAICLLLAVSLGVVQAEPEQIPVCAKYQRTNYTFSEGYKLTAFWLTGSDLNNITKTYDFNNFDYFLLITWDEGGFSLFKSSFIYKPSYLERNYTDQRGVTWRIKEGWDRCY